MEEERGALLSVWDYVILGVTLLLSIGIGLGYGCCRGGQRNTREFLSANRQLGVFSTAISICVSFINAIMVMGVSSEMVFFGTSFALSVFSIFASGLLAQAFVSLFYPLELTSVYEYLELRYQSRTVRIIGVLLYILQQLVFMGFASFAPATALEAVSGIPVWATIIINGLVATFYTTLGGIRAVIWTDVLQCLVMIAGLIAIVIQGVLFVGGMTNVWQLNEKWGRIDFTNIDPDPRVRHTVWSVLIGSTFGWSARFCVGQVSVQRFCNVSTLPKARWSVFINSLIAVLIMSLTCLAGITMFAYYADTGCNPLSARKISSPNQILPYFVVDALNYPGVPGIFISCLFSGALSTISSGLSAMSAVVWKDFLSDNIGRKMTESQRTRLTKLLVVVFGAICIGTGFAASSLGGQILQGVISFMGAIGGPTLGLFVLSAFFPCANWKGASAGAILGFALSAWLSMGATVTGVRPRQLPLPQSNCSAPESLPPFNLTLASSTPALPTSPAAVTSALDVTLLGVTQSTPIANGSDLASLQGLDNFYHVSYLWFGAVGALSVIIIGLIVSFLTGCNRRDWVDPQYLVSVCCCLPRSVRTRFGPGDSDKEKPPPEYEDTHLYVVLRLHLCVFWTLLLPAVEAAVWQISLYHDA